MNHSPSREGTPEPADGWYEIFQSLFVSRKRGRLGAKVLAGCGKSQFQRAVIDLGFAPG
jgi:hypothetical protein